MQQNFDVLIATPGRMLHAEYVQSLVETCAALDQQHITYKFLNKYSSLVASARELTILDSYSHEYGRVNEVASGKYKYKKIMWIDSDISWEPHEFLRLYQSDKDIIGGLYQTGPDGTVAVSMNDKNGNPRFVNKSEFILDAEPIKVDGLGFGFLCVGAGVFEKMQRPWFKTRTMQWPDVPYETDMGEDYSWCVGAKDAGFDIWLDPLVNVEHHKETIYMI
jgi:hypothetical protein